MSMVFPPVDGTSSLTAKAPRLDLPFVVKSPRQGSSVGVHIIKDSASLPAALEDCFRFGEEVIVEEFFPGRELTVGILGDDALPVIEIVPREGFYDYQHKYTKGASEYFVPAESATKPPKPSNTPLFRPSARSGSKSIPASMCFSLRTAA